MILLKNIIAIGLVALLTEVALAGSPIRGAKEGVAIQGIDTVALVTQKAAVKGSAQYTHEWMGPVWFFSSAENRDLFAANPEKYAPQYGGYCAYGVADGYLSKKSSYEYWDVYEGKLYFFASSGAQSSWWRKGASRNINWADQNWPKLKAKLEAE